MLVQCGAAPAATASKLVRALGDAVPETTAGKQDERAPQETAHLLLALVAEQTEEQLRQDAAVRAEQAEGVHKLRIAARRIRSALTTYRTLLEPGVANPLREELRWLARPWGRPGTRRSCVSTWTPSSTPRHRNWSSGPSSVESTPSWGLPTAQVSRRPGESWTASDTSGCWMPWTSSWPFRH